ncbi:DUF2254 domain-containing protein [Agrococcus sp. ProA11]|uniref:DUF2254 domain-containing protein n=1 Tax=Agrococcus chionoecetis TaxID=3153752 RepID=UPI003261BA1D
MSDKQSAGRARGGVPQVQGASWWRDLWKPFWAIPVACAVGAIVLGSVLPMLEEHVFGSFAYVFQGGPEGARGLLSTIATGMISMTSLVFSITMVVLQLASSQFTPRALGGFLDSRVTQGTLGVFTASFVYALTATRSVRGDYGETDVFVPQLSVTVAFLLVLASVGFFLAFIHHITSSIQVAQVISRIGDRTLALADKMYPEPADEQSSPLGTTWSPAQGAPRVEVSTQKRHGQITYLDYGSLVSWAKSNDVVVTVDRPVGEFLTEGQNMLRVWGIDELDAGATEQLFASIGLGAERQLWQDVSFGIRQLVDVAERALSPGINDPTTAVQCIDELHRILRRLVQRQSPSPYIVDDEGAVRIVHHPQSIEDHVRLAVEEISHYGKDSLQVPARLRGMLHDIEGVAMERYLPAIREARAVVDANSPTEAA